MSSRRMAFGFAVEAVLPDKPPILLDNRNAHTADMATQQALSDDAHHQQSGRIQSH